METWISLELLPTHSYRTGKIQTLSKWIYLNIEEELVEVDTHGWPLHSTCMCTAGHAVVMHVHKNGEKSLLCWNDIYLSRKWEKTNIKTPLSNHKVKIWATNNYVYIFFSSQIQYIIWPTKNNSIWIMLPGLRCSSAAENLLSKHMALRSITST